MGLYFRTNPKNLSIKIIYNFVQWKLQIFSLLTPSPPEQVTALKAFVKTLKIIFEIRGEKPYDPEFVNMVNEAEEIKTGKCTKVTSTEFDELWK